jgi:hypothetical protein
MEELVCNLHIHSKYSDGTGDYQSITRAALKKNVDVIIMTDHNIRVKDVEGYHDSDGKRVLMLTGEEVHDQHREPQKNHTLVLGAAEEMASFAYDPQVLMDEVQKSGGFSFLAHPYEYDLQLFHEPDISWASWDVDNFTGIELWNGFSEFKTVARNLRQAFFYGFFPEYIAHGPLPVVLAKWDDLLTSGRKVAVVGGSDAHSLNFKAGFFRKTIFPYEFHFSAINNHLVVPSKLSGELEQDKRMIYHALGTGCSFIGYDLPASTKGFSFTIEDQARTYQMGETIEIFEGATLRVKLPQKSYIRVIHNGQLIHLEERADRLVLPVAEGGYYRVESTIHFLGKERGWIFSNPIYVTSAKKKSR